LIERKKRRAPRDINTMKDRVRAYKRIVNSVLPSLLAEKSEIFSR
jgi:hypothetical protein